MREELAAHDSELGSSTGGGTGKYARTAGAGIVSRAHRRLGLLAPALFDNYRSLALDPAAFFSLSVVRRPVGGVATLLGGGYLASGAAGAGPPPRSLPARRASLRP